MRISDWSSDVCSSDLRQSSTDPNLLRFQYMGDDYGLIDTPGSPGFSASGAAALGAADLAIVVVDPDPVRAPLAEPALRQLESLGVPHVIFVHRLDQARGSLRELLSAPPPISEIGRAPRRERG